MASDLHSIKTSNYTNISKLYVNFHKRNELFATVFFYKKIPVSVSLGPIIYTECSEVYSRFISYEKIKNIVTSFKDETLYPNYKIISHPTIQHTITTICYKFMCILYNNIVNIFETIPESSFVFLFYKEKTSKIITPTVNATYNMDLNCCLKISYSKIQYTMNKALSDMIKNNICPSFPILYYYKNVGKENLTMLVLEQIGPTFPTFFMFDYLFIDDKFFTNIQHIDKILFEFIYGLLCINTRFNMYHGDLHLTNITIFNSRNNHNVAYKIRGINNTNNNTNVAFVFRNCNKTAGILDVMGFRPDINYFTKVFDVSISSKMYKAKDILRLCSLTDTYLMLNNIKTFLSIKNFENTILYSRVNDIIKSIFSMVCNNEQIYKILNNNKWPNQVLLEINFKQYLSNNVNGCIVYKNMY